MSFILSQSTLLFWEVTAMLDLATFRGARPGALFALFQNKGHPIQAMPNPNCLELSPRSRGSKIRQVTAPPALDRNQEVAGDGRVSIGGGRAAVVAMTVALVVQLAGFSVAEWIQT